MSNEQPKPSRKYSRWIPKVLTVAMAGIAVIYGFFFFDPSGDSHPERIGLSKAVLSNTFTPETLRPFNGDSSTTPIYVGIDGLVYDISLGREYYSPGSRYHSIAGTDGSKALRVFGGDIIKKKYPVIGIIE